MEGEPLEAFHAAKTALANYMKLSFIGNDSQAAIYLTADASEFAVGAVVEQDSHSQRKPIAFFSAKLSPAQLRYRTLSHELLAIFLAIRYLQHFRLIFYYLYRP